MLREHSILEILKMFVFRHSEWRKQAKKLRRKRLRQKEAEYRDYLLKKGILITTDLL